MAVVRVQPLESAWETVGVDRYAGIVPESVRASSDRWGPDTASFALTRPLDVPHPDLLPFTPVEIEFDGGYIWEGFIWETPVQGDAITVNCRGWQYQMDDDPFERSWVQASLSDWYDPRQHPSDLTKFMASGTVETKFGMLLIGWQNGAEVSANQVAAVSLDLREEDAKRVVVDFDAFNLSGSFKLWIRGHDGDDGGVGGTVHNASFTSPSSGTQSTTFTSPHRYVSLWLENTGGAFTATQDHLLRLKEILVVRSTAYESGSASVLKVSHVAKDALVLAPRLDQSTALIQTPSETVPEYAPTEPRSGRDHIDAVNESLGWQPRVVPGRKLELRPYPDTTRRKVGDGARFTPAALASGDPIRSEVTVLYQDGNGSARRLVRTQPAGSTLPQRWGFPRGAVISVGAALKLTAAQKLGDVFLAEHLRTPFRGGLVIPAGEFFDFGSNAPVHPSWALADPGELVNLPDQVDPDTGAIGRDGRVVSVEYDEEAGTATCQLDDTRETFDALLAQYGAG